MNKSGLQTITLNKINRNITNAVIIGIIIRNQNERIFSAKKDDQSARGVWNFTLRDSLTDYINVTCWGSAEYIINLRKKFTVGDIVDVISPKISVRQIDDNSEQYRPSVTSPFNLTISEGNPSSIVLHEGENFHQYVPLLHYPTKPAASFLTLADIYNNGATIRGDFIELLVAVQFVGTVKKLKAKTDGREIAKRDITVLDRTHIGMRITFWDDEFINRAEQWKPCETILFLADMRVEWSNFDRCMVAATNTKTIITEDPLIPQAESLREYARTISIYPNSLMDRVPLNFPDPSLINTVMTCKRVLDISLGVYNQPGLSVTSDQFTALLYAFVTDLDLDGFTQVVIRRCERCSQLIDKTVETCINLECPVGSGSEKGNPECRFDIPVTLSDHTGSLTRCRLSGTFAEKVLGITVTDFMASNDNEKCTIKWIYLLERCEVKILVVKKENKLPSISILSCNLANIAEVAAKLPVY